ncbi:hypothetical protein Godav_022228 [Gossypium davidsonii]|uniref:Uncharacterized protein n=1 Tax=Gossypium davidsonii TaxID=34287 RepID=A0A7J8TDI7_GOSDV|nr:hypothetical protein [Gossypium davidsonii]
MMRSNSSFTLAMEIYLICSMQRRGIANAFLGRT